METLVELFKRIWNEQYSYVSLELDYDDIVGFIEFQLTGERSEELGEVASAVNLAVDYQLANGIGEVQE